MFQLACFMWLRVIAIELGAVGPRSSVTEKSETSHAVAIDGRSPSVQHLLQRSGVISKTD